MGINLLGRRTGGQAQDRPAVVRLCCTDRVLEQGSGRNVGDVGVREDQDCHPGIVTGGYIHLCENPRSLCQMWAMAGVLIGDPELTFEAGSSGLGGSGASWPLMIPSAIWIGSAGNPLAFRAS